MTKDGSERTISKADAREWFRGLVHDIEELPGIACAMIPHRDGRYSVSEEERMKIIMGAKSATILLEMVRKHFKQTTEHEVA